MKTLKYITTTAIAGALVAVATISPVVAAEYPSDTIHIVVPWRAGGGTDTIARGLASAMEGYTKKAVVVDNIAGGGGNTGHMSVVKAKRNGLTMLLNGSSDMNSTLIFRNVPFKLGDFDCVGAIYQTPSWVLSHKDQGLTDLGQFIAKAKKEPGKLVVGVGSLISAGNAVAQSIIGSNNLKVRTIPFDGGGPLKKALLANQVTIGVLHAPVMLGAIQKGDLKVLAAAGSLSGISYTPLRGTKTLRDYNTPVDIGVTRGLFVPKGTPADVISQASALVEKGAKSESFKKFGAKFGFAPIWMGGKEYCEYMQAEDKLIRGIKAKYLDK